MGAGQEKNAFFIFSAGAFAHEWDAPAHFSAAATNWSPELTLASVNDLASNVAHPFVDYSAGDGRGTETVDTTTVAEANEWYSHQGSTGIVPGVFYLYDVVDTALPTYAAANALVGFDNAAGGSASALCSGQDAPAITKAGFVPLSTSGGPTGSDLAGGTCRAFAGTSAP